MFTHHPNQGLIPGGSYATGGNGTGSGLGNQGAVVISKNGHWLFMVIASLELMYDGSLELIENSVRRLNGCGVGAAQISSTPWYDGLLVTKKNHQPDHQLYCER